MLHLSQNGALCSSSYHIIFHHANSLKIRKISRCEAEQNEETETENGWSERKEAGQNEGGRRRVKNTKWSRKPHSWLRSPSWSEAEKSRTNRRNRGGKMFEKGMRDYGCREERGDHRNGEMKKTPQKRKREGRGDAICTAIQRCKTEQ